MEQFSGASVVVRKVVEVCATVVLDIFDVVSVTLRVVYVGKVVIGVSRVGVDMVTVESVM